MAMPSTPRHQELIIVRRTKVLVSLASLVLCNGCNDGHGNDGYGDDGPCQYEEVPLAADAETPWGTKVADDIAELEVPQPGTWRWGESEDFLVLDDSGAQMPALATFVHDPETIRFGDHVGGGEGVACHGPMVSVDGMLTITDEQGAVIVSVPLTVERHYMADLWYGAVPQYSPPSLFSDRVHETMQWQTSQVYGSIQWLEDLGLLAEFFYQAQSMQNGEDEVVMGDGVFSWVATFEADGPP